MRNGAADFAAPGEAGEEEELLSTEKQQNPLRRLRGDIAVAAVILVGAVLIARGLSGGKHTTAGTPTPTATGSQGVPLTGPPPRGLFSLSPPPPRLFEPGVCPRATDGESFCTTVRSVPPAFLTVLRSAYPRLVVDSAVTNLLRPAAPEPPRGIWSRTFTGHEGRTHIVVIVSQDGPEGNIAQQVEQHGNVHIYSRVHEGPYTVQFSVRGPSTSHVSQGLILDLETDPRLLRNA